MKIGFIGLGAMGRPMAASLQRAGHALQAYDLRPVEGFSMKSSVSEAARDCELLFTSFPGPAEVEQFQKDCGSTGVIPQAAVDKAVDRLLAAPHFGERKRETITP